MNERPFTIDIWSDIVCPFCCLGEAQLRLALARFEHAPEVVIQFHAFELDPSARPEYTRSLDELVAHKYAIDPDQASRLHRRLEAEAAELGMKWHLENARPGNTFDAHRLIALAAEQGRAANAVHRLFDAYFSRGERVSDRAVLIDIGRELELGDVATMLDSDAFANEVRADEADAMELGFSGVPAMLLDGRFIVSGAQPVDVMLDVLNRAWRRREVA
jgi:predicted DsbA family dithiol-disulfide isomerase